MAGFKEVFNSDMELANLPIGEKNSIMNYVYGQIEKDKEITSEQKRNFRDAQLETLFEDAKEKGLISWGSEKEWNANNVNRQLSGRMPGEVQFERLPEDYQKAYDELKSRNRKEDFKDVVRTFTANPAHWPSAFAKFGLDLLGAVSSAGPALAQGAMNAVDWLVGLGFEGENKELTPGASRPAMQSFTRGLKEWNELDAVKQANEVYNETVKDDPSMFMRVDTALMDTAMGAGMGLGRVWKAGKDIAVGVDAGLAMNPLSLGQKFQLVGTQGLASLTAGQIIYEGLDLGSSYLDSIESLDDDEREGIKVSMGLLGALVGGAALEQMALKAGMSPRLNAALRSNAEIARKIRNGWQAQAAAGAPIDSTQTQYAQGSLAEAIAKDPGISNNMKVILDEVSLDSNGNPVPGVADARTNFSPTIAGESLRELERIEAKVRAGEELSLEEAQILKARGAGARRAYGYSKEELGEIIGEDLESVFKRAADEDMMWSDVELPPEGASGGFGVPVAEPPLIQRLKRMQEQKALPPTGETSNLPVPSQSIPMSSLAEPPRGRVEKLIERREAPRIAEPEVEQLPPRKAELEVVREEARVAPEPQLVQEPRQIKATPAQTVNRSVETLDILRRSPEPEAPHQVEKLKEVITDAVAGPKGETELLAPTIQELRTEYKALQKRRGIVENRLKTEPELRSNWELELEEIDYQLEVVTRQGMALRRELDRVKPQFQEKTVKKMEKVREKPNDNLAPELKARVDELVKTVGVDEYYKLNKTPLEAHTKVIRDNKISLKNAASEEEAKMYRKQLEEDKVAVQRYKQIQEYLEKAYGANSSKAEVTAKKPVEAKPQAKPQVKPQEKPKTILEDIRVRRNAKQESAEVGGRISNAAERVKAEDVETKLAELTPEDRMRIRRVANAVNSSLSAKIGRPLSQQQELTTLASVMNHREMWNGRVYEPSSDLFVENINTRESGVSAGYIEEKYPLASQALRVFSPEAVQSQVFAPNTILGARNGVLARAGIGTDYKGWESMKPLVKELDELWDEIREALPTVMDDNKSLMGFLISNRDDLKLSLDHATAIAESLQDAFPFLKQAIRFDRGTLNGAKGLANSIARVVSMDAKKIDFENLAHELGHVHFNYGLSSAERIEWLDKMRMAAESPELWEMAYPSYRRRLDTIQANADKGKISVEEAQKGLFALGNPLEMYAEQYRAYLFDRVLPNYETLKSYGKMRRGWKKFFSTAKVDFANMSTDMREFFLKTMTEPDVESVKRMGEPQIREGIEGNFYYTASPDEARIRIQEIDDYLQTTYGERMGSVAQTNPLEGVGEVNTFSSIPFNALPVRERIKLVNPDDALMIVEKDALRLIHEGWDADAMAEMQLAHAKVSRFLDPAQRVERIEGMTKARMGNDRAGSLGLDTDGNVIDPGVGNLDSLADVRDREGPAKSFNSFSYATKKMILNGRSLSALSYEKRLAAIVEDLLATGDKEVLDYFKGIPRNSRAFNKRMKEFVEGFRGAYRADSDATTYMWERSLGADGQETIRLAGEMPAGRQGWLSLGGAESRAFSSLERKIREMDAGLGVVSGGSGGVNWGAEAAARSSAIQELAAMEVRAEKLGDLAQYAGALRGISDILDGKFNAALMASDEFAKAWANQGGWWTAGDYLSIAARAGWCGLAGLEYDPDSDFYIPGLGNVSWNYKKFMESPLNMYILAGLGNSLTGGRALKLGGKVLKSGGNKIETAMKKVMPPETYRKWEEAKEGTIGVVKTLFYQHGGVPDEVAQIISQGRQRTALMQRDLRSLAEIYSKKFSPQENEQMFRVVAKDPGWRELEQKWAVDRPDLLSASTLTGLMMDKLKKQFIELGYISPLMKDSSEGSWLVQYINESLRPKSDNKIMILERANIGGLKGGFLAGNRIGWTIRGMDTDPKTGQVFRDADDFRTACANDGWNLSEGDRINVYREFPAKNNQGPYGRYFYAVSGTPTDKKFASVYHPEPGGVWGKYSKGYVISDLGSGKGQIKLEREMSVHERKVAGQSFNLAVNLAKTAEVIGKDARNANIYKMLAESDWAIVYDKGGNNPNGSPGAPKGAKADWLTAKANAELYNTEWAPIKDEVLKRTGISRYGALSGGYLKKDAFNAVKWLDGWGVRVGLENSPLSFLLPLHRGLLHSWKMTKTVFAPVAHVNNFVSNLFMGTMLGHNPLAEFNHGRHFIALRRLEMKAHDALVRGETRRANELYNRISQSPYKAAYEEIKQAQIADSTIWANELKSDEIYANMEALASGRLQADSWAEKMKGAAGVAGKGLGRVYENGDLVFKMGAFYSARKAGASVEDALAHAYEAYFDYGTLSPGARALRDTGIFPFVSYMYKAVPALAKSVNQNPGRVASVLLGLEGFHLANINNEFEDGQALKHSEEMERILPGHVGNKGFLGAARTRPFLRRGEDGRLRFLDLSRMVPGGDVFEVGQQDTSKGFSYSALNPVNMLASLLNQSPVLSLLMETLTLVNPSTKIPTVPGNTKLDDEVVAGRVRDALAYRFWNTFMPNLPVIPYTYSFDSMVAALRGAGVDLPNFSGETGLDRYGYAKPLGSTMSSLMGVKIRDVSMEQVYNATKAQFQQVNIEKGKTRKALKGPQLTEGRKERELEKAKGLLERQTRSIQKKAEAINNLFRKEKRMDLQTKSGALVK